MGLYDKLSKLDAQPPKPIADEVSPVEARPTRKTPSIQHNPTPQKLDSSLETVESSHRDVTTDVVTSVPQDDISRWRKILANTETHNSALRLSAQERDDIEDCILLLRRTLGIKTSMNELARLGLLLLMRDVAARKGESVVCAVKRL